MLCFTRKFVSMSECGACLLSVVFGKALRLSQHHVELCVLLA